MSSTNRSNARDFHIADYYVTPKAAIRKFLIDFIDDELLQKSSEQFIDEIKILDPCAGGNSERVFDIKLEEGEDKKKIMSDLKKVADDVIPTDFGFHCIQRKRDMSYPSVLSEFGMNVLTNDLREDSPAQYHIDFLNKSNGSSNLYDLIITNPPFAIAQEIIQRSLELCKEGGYVVMLLRLNYIGSQERAKFWKENKPYAIYADNKRMSFTPDNGTDSIEYAHFVWKKGTNPDFAKFKILSNK